MIYTLTANPAIDYNIACDGLTANTVTRTRNAVYTPNGKGLNVSFTLDHYGVDTTILGFFAGFSGEFIVKGAMAELHAKGAKNVLLTLGGAGAYFSNGEHIWFANRTFDVKLLSTVCAGDSSLAAFLSVWHDAPERVEDALRLSMATGANVVECPGLGDFAKVDEYKKHIEVRQVC